MLAVCFLHLLPFRWWILTDPCYQLGCFLHANCRGAVCPFALHDDFHPIAGSILQLTIRNRCKPVSFFIHLHVLVLILTDPLRLSGGLALGGSFPPSCPERTSGVSPDIVARLRRTRDGFQEVYKRTVNRCLVDWWVLGTLCPFRVWREFLFVVLLKRRNFLGQRGVHLLWLQCSCRPLSTPRECLLPFFSFSVNPNSSGLNSSIWRFTTIVRKSRNCAWVTLDPDLKSPHWPRLLLRTRASSALSAQEVMLHGTSLKITVGCWANMLGDPW